MHPVGLAVQREAEEEAERERERKEQEEMQAKKEEWERMQREMSQAAQTTKPAGADQFFPRHIFKSFQGLLLGMLFLQWL